MASTDKRTVLPHLLRVGDVVRKAEDGVEYPWVKVLACEPRSAVTNSSMNLGLHELTTEYVSGPRDGIPEDGISTGLILDDVRLERRAF